MSRWSQYEDATERMRGANPVPTTELQSTLGATELSAALGRAIALGESPSRPIPAGDRIAMERGAKGRSGRGIFARHRGASLGLGLACVVAATLVFLLSGGSVDSVRDGGHPEYAAAAVAVAEANPRLLITAPGWSIVHARSFEIDSGSLSYKDGNNPTVGPDARGLELDWYPARLYHRYLRDRAGASPRGPVKRVTSTLLGRRATTFHYAEQEPNFATVLAPQGRVFVEIVGLLGKDEFEAVLRSLRSVGVDTWLAAMPPEVVQPTTRSKAIARMLAELPVPPGFDPEALQSDTVLTDRFMLGKAVAGAVACDWLQRWKSATRTGDDAAAQQAVTALGSARRWPVLVQMVRERGYEGNALPAHGQGWPAQIVAAGREIAAGHLRRKPAAHTVYVNGEPVGFRVPAHAAPVSLLDCGGNGMVPGL
jgi:hypothetical protein